MFNAIYTHNEPLKKDMQAKGFRLKKKGKTTSWYDENGNYVSYPTGFITIGKQEYVIGDSYYFSVRLANGCWAQRSTRPHRSIADVTKWALERAKKELESLSHEN